MAKDPAFLFYSSDFLTGTLIMTFEDRGKYITILAYMHQNGRLKEETIRLLVGSISDNLKSKFGIDDKGNWFNSRLEEEVSKRSNFVESRINNGKKGGRPPKKPNNSLDDKPKPTHNLPEDVNDNEILDENIIDLKAKKNELTNLLCEKFGWNEMRFSNKQRDVSAFVSVKILNDSDYDNFILQFKCYDEYKTLSEERRHSPEKLIGTQSDQFNDSVLLSENWEARLENFKQQNKSKKGISSAPGYFRKIKNVTMTTEIVFDQKNNLSVTVNQSNVLMNEPAFKRPEAYLHNIIVLSVLNSYKHLNWNTPDQEDIKEMVSEIKFAVQNKYKQIRAEEIPDIFADGIRKVYGDYMGLSIVSFEMFIMGYLESRKRKDLAKSLPQHEIKKEPTLQERFEIASKNAIDAFLAFQIGKDISLQAPTVYRFLRGIKLFEYSIDEQQEFYDQAQADVQKELRLKKAVTIEKFKREEIERQLNGETSIEEKITAQQRRLGLYAFFQELILNEIDLQELINQHKPL